MLSRLLWRMPSPLVEHKMPRWTPFEPELASHCVDEYVYSH